MKRVLTFILVLSMILGSIGTVFAAPVDDIAGHKNEKAILRLNNLGIVEGDDRGFAPDDNITRAEFAVLVVRALGLEGSANVSKGDTQFTDVTVAGGYEWASGAINVATKLGYIQGYGGGLFGPADNIRYEDAVTLLVRVLGYEPAVQTKGGYPVGYLVVAEQELDITDHVGGSVGVPATRGAVFQLLDNSLTKPLMVQVGYGDEAKYVISGQKGSEVEKQTILTNKLGLELLEDEVVTEIARVGSLKKDRIKIGSKTYKVVGEVDYEAVFGTEVEAWLNDDGEVVYVEIASEDVYFDALKGVTRDELTLVDADEDYDLAEDVVFYVNGSKLGSSGMRALDEEKYDYAKVVLNDDGDVAFVDAYTWDDFIVVEKVSGNYVYGYGEEVNAKDFSIVKNGKTISLDDLEKGDVFFYSRAGDGFAEVFNDYVEGEIERIYDDAVKIEGKEYKKTIDANYYVKYIDEDDDIVDLNNSSFEDIAEAMQDAGEVAVFLNRVGDMVFLVGDIGDLKTSSDFVFLIADSEHFTDRGTEKWTFDILNAEGAEIKYDVSHKDAHTDKKILKDTDGITELSWDDDADRTNGTTRIVEKQIVELKLDTKGKIDEISLVFAYPKEVDKEIKTTEKYYKGAKIDPDAVVYLIEKFVDNGKVKDIEIKSYKDLDFDYINTATFYEKNDKIVAIAIEKSSRDDDNVAHLTVATAKDSKVAGKEQYTLDLVINGEKVTVDTKVDIENYSRVNKGDLLKVEIDKKTGRINTVAPAPDLVTPGVVSELNTAKKSLKIGAEVGLKLGVDGVVVDATGSSYKVISFSSLKNGDSVKAARVDAGSSYLDVIVRTAKAGDTPPPSSGTTYVVDHEYNVTAFNKLNVKDEDNKESLLDLAKFDTFEFANGVTPSSAVFARWADAQTANFVIDVDAEAKTIEIRADYAAKLSTVPAAQAVNAAYGTLEADAKAKLAAKATIKDEFGAEYEVDLTWEFDAAYVGTTAGAKAATATFTLPTGVTQPTPALTITGTVTVLENTDASVTGITVDGVAAATVDPDDEKVYTVELPNGTDLTALTATDVVVTATDANATVGTPVTADNGATWTVDVTAEDGTTVVTYTINVTVA